MAKRIDKSLISRLSSNADINQFAEELIHHVMHRYSANYTSRRISLCRESVYNAFDETTQRAIDLFGRIVESCNRTSFQHMQANCTVTAYTFIRYANSLSNTLEDCFTLGFNATDFLFYCANVSIMAAIFYSHGISVAPMLARTNIINILRRHRPSDRWHSIHRAAEIAVSVSRSNEPLRRNTDLPEVETQNETQDEVNVGGSRNTSQSEEQNVLPETEERSIDQRIKDACSRYETSIQRFAQYFTEGISTEDSSSLNESNSSPFNFDGNKFNKSSGLKGKPGPGASNVDNKPILVKSENRRKFNSARIDSKAGSQAGSQSQSLGFKEKKVARKSASDDRFCPGPSSAYQASDQSSKTNNRINLDPNFKFENPEILCFEGDKHTDGSSKAVFHTEKSNIQQCSRLTNEKDNVLVSGEKTDNYQPIKTDEKCLVSETEPNEKLVSEMQSSNQVSVHSAEVELYFSSDKENNANAENLLLSGQEKSPKLKNTSMNTKQERLRSPSRDSEKSPPGKTNLK